MTREDNMKGRAYSAEKFYMELRAAVLSVCNGCVRQPGCVECPFRLARGRAIVPVVFSAPEGYFPKMEEEDPPNQQTGEVFYCRNCGKLIGKRFWLCHVCREYQVGSGRDFRPTGDPK